MTCTTCGAANPPGQKFCGECGTRLASGCPTCGAQNPPGQKFCGECGTALGGGDRVPSEVVAPQAAGTMSAAQAERRLVSVLFADLVGFTPFAEERDAEEVRDTLTRYFDLARDVIARYGGTVEKFIGDAVMAVWGAPVAREDDAERAVRAALELVDVVRTLGRGIEARAGVLTGEAAVTLNATNQGMVAGDLVNTAARLQSIAPPGAVLVGEATQRSASGAIAFEEAGEQVLKGKSAPVAAWRALRVVANRGGQGRSDLPEPPFVGRDEELRILKDAITAQARDPRVRVVSITGPAGIGKSRLAWELEKYVDGLVESVYWHRGRSPAYGEGITFWALGEMVRQRAGLAESDDDATTRERVEQAVRQYVAAEEDRRWVEPAMLALLGLGDAPPGGRDVLFAAWRIFFERIAALGTTVLLFEDLQWADTGLMDFIDHLVEWARAAPILVVTLARPELFDRRPTWGAGTRHFTSLAVEPLSPTAMRELLDGFVPGLPQAAVATILARADGIPLYAVEMVRSLVAGGRLRQVDGTYRPTGDLGDIAIPETLQSLIASRLDTFDAADRSLIQDAAVLGQTFTPAALAAVTGSTTEELEPRLRALVRREVLELQADPRSPERGQYAFVQSLIREVAYGTLSRRDRRSRHLAVARYFEGLGDDELAGMLATHYVAAHRASTDGPEADAVAIQARLALRAAATRAATLGAHEQAVVFLRQAIELSPDAADRAEMLQEAADSAAAAVDYAAAIELAQRAIEERGAGGSAAARAAAIGLLGRVYIWQGDIERAAETLESALALVPEGSDDAVRARLLVDLSQAMMRRGNALKAIEYADLGLPIAERLELQSVLADGFNNKGASLSYLGRVREAIALMEAAVGVATEAGLGFEQLRARNNLASISWTVNPARALELGLEGYHLAERLGNRGAAYWALGQVTAGMYLAARDWDMIMARTAEALAQRIGDTGEAQMLATRNLILTARGERDEHTLPRLLEVERLLSDGSVTAAIHSVRADNAELEGDHGAAREHLVEAANFEGSTSEYLSSALHPAIWAGDATALRRILERYDGESDAMSPLNRAYRAVGWAALAAVEGRRREAIAALRTGVVALRDLGFDLEFARFVVDAMRILGPDEPELRRLADDARAIFTRVNATHLLAQLDEVLAASAAHPSTGAGRPTASEAAVPETA